MNTHDPTPGRSSDVLDAILDKVSDNRSRTQTTSTLFRARALDQLDIAAEIDNQLPLVSRRNWLLLVGAALVVLGFLLWAALTPAAQIVVGEGRVLAPQGLLPITSPIDGVVKEMRISTGSTVSAGDIVTIVATAQGDAQIHAVAAGTTWQVLNVPGSAAAAGRVMATLVPAGSDTSALVVVNDVNSDQIRPGMTVNAGGKEVGTVSAVEPPLPGADVELRTGVDVPPGELASIVQVTLDQPATPGTETSFTIELSDQTVLEQILHR